MFTRLIFNFCTTITTPDVITDVISGAVINGDKKAISKAEERILSFFYNMGSNLFFLLIRAAIFIIAFVIARKILLKLIDILGDKMDRRNVPQSLKDISLWLINYGITLLMVGYGVVYLGLVKSASIAALIAAMGVGISLALQGAISNFAGGILLLALKPFREGDYIVTTDSGIEGTVVQIHVYYTTLRTVYNDVIRVPNSKLTNQSIKNSMADGNKRVEIHVGVGYDEDIDRALAILESIVDADNRIHKDRRAFFVHELGSHAIVLGIRCVVKREDYLEVNWSLNHEIRLAFAREGINIPYEQLDVHIK